MEKTFRRSWMPERKNEMRGNRLGNKMVGITVTSHSVVKSQRGCRTCHTSSTGTLTFTGRHWACLDGESAPVVLLKGAGAQGSLFCPITCV